MNGHLPAARLEILARRRVEFQIDREPEHLCVADEPDSKSPACNEHGAENHPVGADAKNVAEQRPDTERDDNGRSISDCDMRQKVSGFAEEEEATFRAAFRRVEIAAKEFPSVTKGASKVNQASERHIYSLAGRGILLPCLTTVLMSSPL